MRCTVGYIVSLGEEYPTLDQAVQRAKDVLHRGNQTPTELYIYKRVGKVKATELLTFEEVKE